MRMTLVTDRVMKDLLLQQWLHQEGGILVLCVLSSLDVKTLLQKSLSTRPGRIVVNKPSMATVFKMTSKHLNPKIAPG
jgi:hypothetical protein